MTQAIIQAAIEVGKATVQATGVTGAETGIEPRTVVARVGP